MPSVSRPAVRVDLELVVEELRRRRACSRARARTRRRARRSVRAGASRGAPRAATGSPTTSDRVERNLEQARDHDRLARSAQRGDVDLEPDQEEQQDQAEARDRLDALDRRHEAEPDPVAEQHAREHVGEDQRLLDRPREERERRRDEDRDADVGAGAAGWSRRRSWRERALRAAARQERVPMPDRQARRGPDGDLAPARAKARLRRVEDAHDLEPGGAVDEQRGPRPDRFQERAPLLAERLARPEGAGCASRPNAARGPRPRCPARRSPAPLSWMRIFSAGSMSSKTAIFDEPTIVRRRTLCGSSHERWMWASRSSGKRSVRKTTSARGGLHVGGALGRDARRARLRAGGP